MYMKTFIYNIYILFVCLFVHRWKAIRDECCMSLCVTLSVIIENYKIIQIVNTVFILNLLVEFSLPFI